MPPPFHSLENPFEPPKKRLKDDAELIGKFLGRAAEEEMRKIMAKEKRRPEEPEWEPFRLSNKEKARIEAPELSKLREEEAATLKAFFGESITVQPLPHEITPERIKNWEAMGFELHYLPPMDMTEDADFPGWEKKPRRWFYEEIADGRIAKDATMLPGAWVLVDGRQKPDYAKGAQMYDHDPLAPVLEDLNRRGVISQSNFDETKLDPRSRFGLSPADFTKPEVMNAFAKALDLKPGQASLTETIVWNVLANIHHPEWGTTDTTEWQKETSGSGGRLISGRSGYGGASGVGWGGRPFGRVGFRPLGRFSS
ncbi:hypothetical protein A3E39_04520 [Candidatus Uhrbacteria bacterium RIFCSPHIGHO2_12_FULL_60_25]|uniref:Uncharacterized protein n=1 Tax=Candidatus Uhrbacteria bacterium RIFCSPHIGHO2_12_FULL_60_25 TaxID=1802399 RepID=A0A1F7UIP2_9BACT|nr:MAG: hypothetical protein A3D73_01070 [Candidatus Uhrbacteria bacterium RIFCSPHIGHO2_02_FULL_60_44]OGL78151.1 MAG: hypothetical protein A3E39_04520 [Candidatus Uhrbacteria bacterium RIFCSPHIGHO2_12_FULL_60_25]